jgi:hypothetical protein
MCSTPFGVIAWVTLRRRHRRRLPRGAQRLSASLHGSLGRERREPTCGRCSTPFGVSGDNYFSLSATIRIPHLHPNLTLLPQGFPQMFPIDSQSCYCCSTSSRLRCRRRVKRSRALRGRNPTRDNSADGAPMALFKMAPVHDRWTGAFTCHRTPESCLKKSKLRPGSGFASDQSLFCLSSGVSLLRFSFPFFACSAR